MNRKRCLSALPLKMRNASLWTLSAAKSASADDLPEYWLLHYAPCASVYGGAGMDQRSKSFFGEKFFRLFWKRRKRLAEWIIAFLDEEAAYALFKRCHWDNNFLCCISNECFIRHQDWDCCFKYKRWEVLIEQGQFGWIPMEENVSEWGPMLAQRGCFEVLYSRNQLSFIAEYGKRMMRSNFSPTRENGRLFTCMQKFFWEAKTSYGLICISRAS